MRVLVGILLCIATSSVAFDPQSQCMFAGKVVGDGGVVCNDGTQQQCAGGTWKVLGTSCARGTGRVMPGVDAPGVNAVAPPQQPSGPRQPTTNQPPAP